MALLLAVLRGGGTAANPVGAVVAVEEHVAVGVVDPAAGVVGQHGGGHQAHLRDAGQLLDADVDGGVAVALPLPGVGEVAQPVAVPGIGRGALLQQVAREALVEGACLLLAAHGYHAHGVVAVHRFALHHFVGLLRPALAQLARGREGHQHAREFVGRVGVYVGEFLVGGAAYVVVVTA